MFRSVLVPVDLTEKNEHAVRLARELAGESRGEVTLLHVIETLDLPFDELEEFYRRLEEKAARGMETLAEPLRAAEIPHHREVAYGKRGEAIVEYAERHANDLIIMSSHRVDLADPGSGWTTLSYKVAILAQCPVLLVK
ncbi:MAG: universal stress protein [Gemmatimonadota bacterium]